MKESAIYLNWEIRRFFLISISHNIKKISDDKYIDNNSKANSKAGVLETLVEMID